MKWISTVKEDLGLRCIRRLEMFDLIWLKCEANGALTLVYVIITQYNRGYYYNNVPFEMLNSGNIV